MTLREDYNRDGYAIMKDCVSMFAEFISCTWLEKESIENSFSKGRDFYTSFLIMSSKRLFLQSLFEQPKITEFFRKKSFDCIAIEQPVLHVMSPALRIPDGYYGTTAHQDWPSTQGSLDCVTVWIALTDASIGNFPLEVIPGSHKRGLLDGKMNGSVLEVEADDKEFVSIECKAGDVIFLSGFLVHRTGSGTGFRVAVSQRFDNAAESTFIERGYPCAQKRVVDREIRWKPTIEEVQKIYVD